MRFIKYNFVLPINSNYMKRSSKAVISLLFACLLLGTPTKSLALEPTSAVANDTKERNWTIQGQILENSVQPLPIAGVNVLIKGTTIGTISDTNGYFSIKAQKGDVIVFTYLGFRPYEFVVSRAISNLSVSLSEDSEALDEVIITGFSEEKKLNSISSVSTLDIAKNLNSKPITSISQSLQGGVTGLTVTQSSGMPGGDGASIKIRGISSLHTNNDPLVLVDGIPMDMNQLDPNTIESVTILKDAAAAAIYGARAANGVIVVKTKRGTVGKINVSYDGYFGIQKATYLPDFVNAAEYMTMANIAQKNIGGDELYDGELIKNTIAGTDPYKYPDTDWADFLFGTGYVQNHSVAVSGGGSLARFALSVNYMQNEGLTEHTSSDRLNIRANTTVSLRDNLSVNMDFNAYRTNRKQPKTDAADKSLFEWMYKTPPNTVTRYPKKAGSDFTYYGNRPNMTNPAAYIDRAGIREDYEDNISVNISPRWEVLPNLVLKGQYSYRISSRGGKSKREAYNFFDYDTDALLNTWGADFSDYRDHDTYYYLGGTAEYTYDKGDHRLFVIGGYNQELTHQNSWDSYSMISMFAKANYTYDRRYLIEGTVRRDGSSRFGDGEKFGVFPSIAAGWNVHEEKFMKSLKNEINELKLRASYGLLGNENIGLYKYQTFIDMGNGEEKEYGNPEITWEKVKMLNIGADIRLFKDLSLTFDWYEKTTSGMLITPPISSIGGTWATAINSGKVCNRGWEFSANYDKQFKDFGFSIHGGLSQNKNKIIDLYEGVNEYGIKTFDDLKIVARTGSYYGDIYGKKFQRVESGEHAGKIIVDAQGLPLVTSDDYYLGNQQPDCMLGWTNSFSYKNISLSFLIDARIGGNIYSATTANLYKAGNAAGTVINGTRGEFVVPNSVTSDGNGGYTANSNAVTPELYWGRAAGGNIGVGEAFLYDATNIRLRNITVGYDFEKKWLEKTPLQKVRVSFVANNVWMIVNHLEGIDPESISATNSNATGFENGAAPTSRSFTFNVTVGF